MGVLENPGLRRLSILLLAGGLILLSSGCASAPDSEKPDRARTLPRVDVEMDRGELVDATKAPLYDFNLQREEIPPELKIIEDPYSVPKDQKCPAAQYEIMSLDRVLGPDPADTVIIGKDGRTYTINTADALGSTLSGLIPYRDVIRYVSGANEHEKRIGEAIYKGQIRRAWLKGWMAANDCHWIPSPRIKPDKS